MLRQAELSRLKGENAQLEEEMSFLKKAATLSCDAVTLRMQQKDAAGRGQPFRAGQSILFSALAEFDE